MQRVARLENLQHRALLLGLRFHPLNGMVNVWVELSTVRLDALEAMARKRLPKLSIDQLETLPVFFIGGIAVRGERPIERIQNGKQSFDQPRDAAVTGLVALSLDALPIVLEVGLSPDQRLPQLFFFCLELGQLLGGDGSVRRWSRGVLS